MQKRLGTHKKYMKQNDKQNFLQDNHMGHWLQKRQEVENELSDKQGMFCICGRLATGMHERGCRKFSKLVNDETVKRLEHLL